MNILIAKTILQSWINENDFALYENDAEANYLRLWDYCFKRRHKGEEFKELVDCLIVIQKLKMEHILANKAV